MFTTASLLLNALLVWLLALACRRQDSRVRAAFGLGRQQGALEARRHFASSKFRQEILQDLKKQLRKEALWRQAFHAGQMDAAGQISPN